MPSQQDIDRFTLAFHERALVRLHSNAQLSDQALRVLDCWEARDLSDSSRRYRDELRALLHGDWRSLRRAICSTTDHAATLRSMSPLGFLLDDAERLEIRRAVMTP